MKAVIQRVKTASVGIEGEVVSSIGKGLLILLGIQVGDTEEDIDYLSRKIAFLRIFEREGKFNDSLMDIGGEA
ncbi:D-aminoacyl-tRNA deacylase, partial [candidate division WOR-3 bacterium]|nr:D-aminoacyl-tRNA deacylase [candidate division WOR-3 bacterium]